MRVEGWGLRVEGVRTSQSSRDRRLRFQFRTFGPLSHSAPDYVCVRTKPQTGTSGMRRRMRARATEGVHSFEESNVLARVSSLACKSNNEPRKTEESAHYSLGASSET